MTDDRRIARVAPGALEVSRAGAVERAVAHLIGSRRSANTREAYARDWARWRAHADDLAAPTLEAATAFREGLAREGLSASTRRRVLTCLSFLYKSLHGAGLVAANPFTSAWLPRPERSASSTQVLEAEDARRLLEAAGRDRGPAGFRDYALLRVLHDTGLRRGSAQRILREGIDPRGARVVVKGGREERVSFGDDTSEAVRAWLAVAPASPWLFPSPENPLKPIHLATVNRILERRAKQAGVEHVHPHRFRATFITDGYSAEVYERDLQAAAHHRDAATTRSYDRGARGETAVGKIAEYREKEAEKEREKPEKRRK